MTTGEEMRMVSKIFGIILLLMCFFGYLGGGLKDGPSAAPFIFLGIIAIFLLLKKSKTKEQKAEIKQKREEQREYESTHITLIHMAGLPIAQGTTCKCGLEKEMFTFLGEGNTFNLKFDKITNISIKTDVEIQQQYVSSVGGAVGGAVLFGPLGAIVGGRAKKKRSVEKTHYLILTYLRDGNVDYISFEITTNLLSKVTMLKVKFDREYKQNISATVEL